MEVHLHRVLIYAILPILTHQKNRKMGKNELAHLVAYGTDTDPKLFNMTFYGSVGMFLMIFGDFGFFRFFCTRARPRARFVIIVCRGNLPKYVKKRKIT